MAILPIVTYDDDMLRQKAKPVRENSAMLQNLIGDMLETMYNSSGVGLAAPQVGKLMQVFVMDADAITDELEEINLGPMVFINPEIIELSGDEVKMEEGCLSIPDVRDDVKRPVNAKIRYLNRDFKEQESAFSGWISRIIQHESDHLNGTLFLDYLSSFKKRLHRSALRKIDKGDIESEYPLVPKKGLV